MLLLAKRFLVVCGTQGGDLTRPYPARRPPEVAPCHLISTSYLEVLGLFRVFKGVFHLICNRRAIWEFWKIATLVAHRLLYQSDVLLV